MELLGVPVYIKLFSFSFLFCLPVERFCIRLRRRFRLREKEQKNRKMRERKRETDRQTEREKKERKFDVINVSLVQPTFQQTKKRNIKKEENVLWCLRSILIEHKRNLYRLLRLLDLKFWTHSNSKTSKMANTINAQFVLDDCHIKTWSALVNWLSFLQVKTWLKLDCN